MNWFDVMVIEKMGMRKQLHPVMVACIEHTLRKGPISITDMFGPLRFCLGVENDRRQQLTPRESILRDGNIPERGQLTMYFRTHPKINKLQGKSGGRQLWEWRD